jgi:hypothetical protein
MSAKTQKNWRELRSDLHNGEDLDNLMEVVNELNGALEQRELEMTTLPRRSEN